MSHILTRIGQLWRDRKIILRAGPELKFENYESVQHRPQFSGIKKGAKISFHRHFKVCPEDETIARTGAVKVDTKDGTTRGMGLPGVEELEMEG